MTYPKTPAQFKRQAEKGFREVNDAPDATFEWTFGPMTAYTFAPIAPVAGNGGSVDGYETRCSCGLVLRSSLRTGIEAEMQAHTKWHSSGRARKHVCKIHTVRDGKTVCAYCGDEMSL